MKHPTHPPHGFSFLGVLLLALIVAFILGVLPNKIGGRLEFGRVIRAKGGMESLSDALRTYKSQNGFYPSTSQGLKALIVCPLTQPIPTRWQCLVDAPTIPRDPWDNAFYYACPGKRHPYGFDLFSCGPDGIPYTADDIEN